MMSTRRSALVLFGIAALVFVANGAAMTPKQLYGKLLTTQ